MESSGSGTEEPLIRLYFTWNIPSGAKARHLFSTAYGTTEVVP
jgi:hypothetical protein